MLVLTPECPGKSVVGNSGLLHLAVVLVSRLWMTYYAFLAQYPKDYACHQEGLSLLS